MKYEFSILFFFLTKTLFYQINFFLTRNLTTYIELHQLRDKSSGFLQYSCMTGSYLESILKKIEI